MKWFCFRAAVLLGLMFVAPVWARADKHKLPAAKPAAEYPAKDPHVAEHVTVAADPLDTKEKLGAFRVDYLKHGLMPVRMIVTNDGDKAIKLDQARIYFIAADGEKLKAITEEQAERRLRDIKTDPSRGMATPFPFPRGPKLQTKMTDVSADYAEADFDQLTVAPHTTQSGVLFFDVSDYSHPLKGASLYVKEIQDAGGKDLFPFEPKFDPYLDTKPKELSR